MVHRSVLLPEAWSILETLQQPQQPQTREEAATKIVAQVKRFLMNVPDNDPRRQEARDVLAQLCVEYPHFNPDLE
jgi:hypothetical protein